jgi:hypothetical protein
VHVINLSLLMVLMVGISGKLRLPTTRFRTEIPHRLEPLLGATYLRQDVAPVSLSKPLLLMNSSYLSLHISNVSNLNLSCNNFNFQSIYLFKILVYMYLRISCFVKNPLISMLETSPSFLR